LRKYRKEYKEIITEIPKAIENITESDAKVAFLWMLGEYGQEIEEAPYILEYYINNMKETQESLKFKHMVPNINAMTAIDNSTVAPIRNSKSIREETTGDIRVLRRTDESNLSR
jgi:hypothetical protein